MLETKLAFGEAPTTAIERAPKTRASRSRENGDRGASLAPAEDRLIPACAFPIVSSSVRGRASGTPLFGNAPRPTAYRPLPTRQRYSRVSDSATSAGRSPPSISTV